MSTQVLIDEMLGSVTQQDIVDLAALLISTPSFAHDEKRVMGVVREYIESHGLDVEEVSQNPERPNLIVNIGSGRPILAINGHLDTMPVDELKNWETDPFKATIKGDRLYGLGALDMKAPCAVMLLIAACFSQHSENLNGTLQLQFVSDEESGTKCGTHFLVDEMKAGRFTRPDMVISAERTALKVMNAERGSFKFTVAFRGKSTHTATARAEGINPIAHAARAVTALEKDLPRFHPEVGYGVISVNSIQGGSFASAVPAECTIFVDRRPLPGETNESTLSEAEDAIREALKDFPEADYELKPLPGRYGPPSITPSDSRVVQAIYEAHQRVTGQPAEPFVDWAGATDGRMFRYEGIDTVVYGPKGANAHSSNEFVEIPSLMTQLRVIATAVVDILVP